MKTRIKFFRMAFVASMIAATSLYGGETKSRQEAPDSMSVSDLLKASGGSFEIETRIFDRQHPIQQGGVVSFDYVNGDYVRGTSATASVIMKEKKSFQRFLEDKIRKLKVVGIRLNPEDVNQTSIELLVDDPAIGRIILSRVRGFYGFRQATEVTVGDLKKALESLRIELPESMLVEGSRNARVNNDSRKEAVPVVAEQSRAKDQRGAGQL